MITKINELLNNKKISCVELINKFLNEIEKRDGSLNSYITVTKELAIESAKKVDLKIANGEKLNPLEGIPITLKDVISTKGIETTCASEMLKGYVPTYDAFVWNVLKEQGCVLLGKTNLDEFAMGSSCETSFFKGSKNPHDESCSPGGSSGGGAAAVAAGLAVCALGSDTGGSIRQPSSFCGVVGVKPTYGAVSRFGLIPLASSLDQIGPITSHVKDSAIIFDAIAIKDPMDATCVGKKEATVPHLEDSLKGVKIGIAKQFFNFVKPEVEKSVKEAMKIYEKLGVNFVEIELPSIEHALQVYYIITCSEASSNLGRFDGIRFGNRASEYADVNDLIVKTRTKNFGEEVKRRILLGTYFLSSDRHGIYYEKALKVRKIISHEFNEAFKKCDAIISPTSPTVAFKSGLKNVNPVEAYQADICTVPVNIAGLPAISIPCGFNSEKLPIGLQLIGPKFSESRLFNLGYMFEKETGGCYAKKVGGVELEWVMKQLLV